MLSRLEVATGALQSFQGDPTHAKDQQDKKAPRALGPLPPLPAPGHPLLEHCASLGGGGKSEGEGRARHTSGCSGLPRRGKGV